MQHEQALIDAIKSGDEDCLAELLHSADDLVGLLSATISVPRPTNHAIGRGMTLLQLASVRSWEGGSPGEVLIDQGRKDGAEVDLHSACGLGRIDRIVEILSAKPDAFDRQVDTYVPLQFAITAGRPESIECLLAHGDDPNRELRKVAYFGWEDETLGQKYTSWKPIHMASLWGFDKSRVPVAQALAAGGADLNAVSPLDGYRPIHLVAMPNRVEMICYLVAAGVDVDSRTEKCEVFEPSSENAGPLSGYGCTALMVAAAEGFAEATTCLLELGADPKAKSDDGQTALDFANNRFWDGQPYDEVIELLTRA